MSNTSVSQLVQGIPADLKGAIAKQAAADETNMNDVVVSILAKRYGVAFEPTGRPSSAPPGASTDLVLRMPEKLRTAIKVAAARSGSTARDTIVAILSESFGTRFASHGRGRRARSRARQAASA